MKHFFTLIFAFIFSIQSVAGPLIAPEGIISRQSFSAGDNLAANSKAILDLKSTTKGMLPPRMTTAQRELISSPPEGLIVFDTDLDTLYQYTGSAWSGVGAGGSGEGGVNYITNGKAEAANETASWVGYADAAGLAPVDGTGGTPTTTLTRTTVAGEIRRGSGSFKISKPASNRQGDGFAYDFTLNKADYDPPQMQTIEFEYKASSGFSFGSGTASAPSDIVVYIYAKDSGVLIQPTNYQLDGSGKYIGQFQPLSTDDDYRLIAHVATTSAVAWDFFHDSVKVGPQNVARGPPVTDETSYTSTLSAAFGTPSSTEFKWWQVGDKLRVRFYIANGTVAATAATFTLPPGLTANLSGARVVGGWHSQSGQVHGSLFIAPATPTVVQFGISTNWASPATGTTLGTASFVSGTLEVPIVGWSSSTAMSSVNSGASISATAKTTGAGAIANATATALDFATVLSDDAGSITGAGTGTAGTGGSWTYTVKARKRLTIAANAMVAVPTGTASLVFFIGYKNGVEFVRGDSYTGTTATAGGQSIGVNLFFNDWFNPGDALTFKVYQNTGAARTLDNNGVSNYISIIDGSASTTIAQEPSVSVRYRSSSGQSIAHNAETTYVYGVKEWDSCSCYNPVTGIFTAPMSGEYTVNAGLAFAAVNPGGVFTMVLAVRDQAGTGKVGDNISTGNWTQNWAVSANTSWKLLQGQTVRVVVYQNTGVARLASIDETRNWVEIRRVGNY